MNPSRPNPVLALSRRIYRLLLRAYPAAYRRDWGEPMAQLFRDCSAEEFSRQGYLGLAQLWLRTLWDLARSLPREYARGKRPATAQVIGGSLRAEPLENFTPRAQQALALARREADRLRHNYVGTEHLLLAIVQLPEVLATKTLRELGADLEALRAAVERRAIPGLIEGAGRARPFTPRVKKTLALAGREARSLGHTYLGTEHLLLGLMLEGGGVAARVLDEFGLTTARVRAAYLRDPDFAKGMTAPEQAGGPLKPAQLRHVQFAGEGKFVRQNGQENRYGHIQLRLSLIAIPEGGVPAVCVIFSAPEHELPDAQWAVVQRALLRWHGENASLFGAWRLVIAISGGSCDPAATPAFGEAAVIAANEAVCQATTAKVLGFSV